MALSNIIRQPRRELTESAMGILVSAVVIGILYLPGYYLGSWFQEATIGPSPDLIWLWTLIAMVLLFFGGWIVLLITHSVGERFCNNLANRGIELRGNDVKVRRNSLNIRT